MPDHREHVDALVVGAGFAGMTTAQQLAERLGWRCAIIDRRPHIGGNCHDRIDEHGLLIHQYGPHYFRTNSERVIAYLSRFTGWKPANYLVTSRTGTPGAFRDFQFPLNLVTFEQFLGRPSSSEEFAAWLDSVSVKLDHPPRNSEEAITSRVGKEWFNLFFRGYTLKQWRLEPRQLDASVCARIPLRLDRDCRYLSENFQQMPDSGYTRIFERMLASSPLLSFHPSTPFASAHAAFSWKFLVWTGPLDEFFNHSHGHLPYRSLQFEWIHSDHDLVNPTVQTNYPDPSIPWTREVELKHLTGQTSPGTTICREFPADFTPGSEPFYPIPSPESQAIATRYRELARQAEASGNVAFVGRLASYRYYNMDQVIASALVSADRIVTAQLPQVPL